MDPTTVSILVSFGEALAAAVPQLVALFTAAGSKDGFIQALEAALVVARAKDTADLAAKHYPPAP